MLEKDFCHLVVKVRDFALCHLCPMLLDVLSVCPATLSNAMSLHPAIFHQHHVSTSCYASQHLVSSSCYASCCHVSTPYYASPTSCLSFLLHFTDIMSPCPVTLPQSSVSTSYYSSLMSYLSVLQDIIERKQ